MLTNKAITINVGGTLFTTTDFTLCNSTLFLNLKETYGTLENIFIDRDPQLFTHILRLLRNPQEKIPKECALELDYYMIDYTNENLITNDYNENITQTIDKLINKIEECCNLFQTPFKAIKGVNLCFSSTCNKVIFDDNKRNMMQRRKETRIDINCLDGPIYCYSCYICLSCNREPRGFDGKLCNYCHNKNIEKN